MSVERQYRIQDFNHTKADMKAYEIQRDDGSLPYTVIIDHYSEQGDRYLFNALYWCDSWARGEKESEGIVSDDTKFCIELWKKMGLEELHGSFHPKHIEHNLLSAYTVYRRSFKQVMKERYGIDVSVEYKDKKIQEIE